MSLLLLNSQYGVDKPLPYSWDVSGSVEKPLAYSWTVYQSIEKSLPYSWHVIATIEKALAYSWTIYQSIEKPLTYSWRIIRFFVSSAALRTFRSVKRKKVFRRPPPQREDDFE